VYDNNLKMKKAFLIKIFVLVTLFNKVLNGSISRSTSIWPNGIIYYEINNESFNGNFSKN
jgi:hypothetical protein